MIAFLLYKNYRFTAAVKFWVRRKFTPAGGVAIAALILTGGIGVDTSQAIAYQGFMLLWCLLVVSMLWSIWPAPALKAERILPRVGTAGQPLHYRVTVLNPGEKTQGSITVAEDTGDPRPTFVEFARTPEPGERRRNPFDRFFRFYRWMWLVASKQLAVSVPAKLPPIKPGRHVNVDLQLVPKKRGHLRLQGLLFSVTDPFSLCRSFSRCAAPQSVLILPKRYLLPRISLGGASHYQPGGVTLASSVGDSEEFLSVREYRRGDPLRHIHWKSTSKTGKLIVKEFQTEYFVRQALVLDTFIEETASALFEEAVSLAASFALALNSQESLLDLLFVGSQAYSVTSGHGVAQVEHVLEILASVQPAGRGTFQDLENLVLQQIALVSGCVCIFLKWDDERQALIDQLSSLAVPQLVIVLRRPKEKDPVITLKDHRFARVVCVDISKIQETLSRL